jgi:8-oxo-dGTP diphosphatase
MLAFIFDGGVLSADHQRQIHLRDGQRDGYWSSDEQEAAKLLRPYVWRRLNRRYDGIRARRTTDADRR